MSELETSLDTPLDDGDIVSGHNFREVAPEVLSPLAWSLVGGGMERGFRFIAELLGDRRRSARPTYAIYRSFRPFHHIGNVESIVARVPGVTADDCWTFLLGGTRPAGLPREPAVNSPLTRLRATPRGARLLLSSDERRRVAAGNVASAERFTATALESRDPFTFVGAFRTAAEAAQEAWALHAVTTSCAVAGAAVASRVLRLQYGDAAARDLVMLLLHRGSAHPGVLSVAASHTDRVGRLVSYEVGDRGERFRRWARTWTEATAAPTATDEVLPAATAGDRLVRRLVSVVATLVAERERSKALGLRALDAVRHLLDARILGEDVDDAVMLGAHEFVTLPPAERARLAAQRAEELEQVAGAALPVSAVFSNGVLTGVAGATGRGGSMATGQPLAPGWAVGLAVDVMGGGGEGVLFGERVEAQDILALQPEAVVTTWGSVLSHIAIVCRELGIPLVSGVPVDWFRGGEQIEVDGWAGTVRRTAL